MTGISSVMVCNVLVKLGWIAAAVCLIIYGHPVAGGFCIFAGIIAGWDYTKDNTKKEGTDESN